MTNEADTTEDETGDSRYEIHWGEDHAGEWRWNLVAGNGEIVADSSEGYATADGVLGAIDRIKENTGMSVEVKRVERVGRVTDES